MKEKLVKITVRFDTIIDGYREIFYRVEGRIQKEWIVMIAEKAAVPYERTFIRDDRGASDYRIKIQHPSQDDVSGGIQVQKGEIDWS